MRQRLRVIGGTGRFVAVCLLCAAAITFLEGALRGADGKPIRTREELIEALDSEYRVYDRYRIPRIDNKANELLFYIEGISKTIDSVISDICASESNHWMAGELYSHNS